MRNPYRDEPELDWEDYCERNEDKRPIIDICPICNKPVRGEDDYYEKDEAYGIDGYVVHSDCVLEFLSKQGYEL